MKKIIFFFLKKIRKLFLGREETIRKIPFATKVFNFLYQFSGPKGVVLADVQGRKMFVPAKSSGFVLAGCWEKDETEIFKDTIKNGMTVVDIGAHIGYYTLLASFLVGKEGKIYAFEPEPENYSLLARNIKINGCQNIVSAKKAISNKTGSAKLFLGTSALHSIVDYGAKKQSIEVETITLDDFFAKKEKIDVIKMDAEGAEYMIFQGMEKVLKNNKSLIIFTEFYPALLSNYVNPKDYLKKLVKNNFKLFVINKRKIEPFDINLFNKVGNKESVNLLCKRA